MNAEGDGEGPFFSVIRVHLRASVANPQAAIEDSIDPFPTSIEMAREGLGPLNLCPMTTIDPNLFPPSTPAPIPVPAIARTLARHPRPLGGDTARSVGKALVSLTGMVLNNQRSEVRDQRSEVRGQRSEVRDQSSEIGGQRTEDGLVQPALTSDLRPLISHLALRRKPP